MVSMEDNYDIRNISLTDPVDDPSRPQKYVPVWAREPALSQVRYLLYAQYSAGSVSSEPAKHQPGHPIPAPAGARPSEDVRSDRRSLRPAGAKPKLGVAHRQSAQGWEVSCFVNV